MIGQIVMAHSNRFEVLSDGNYYDCTLRGVLKIKSNYVVVGDYVDFSNGVIGKILPRKSFFMRPNVANVDLIVIVLASKPVPDFLLVDKLLVSAAREGVDVVFAVNKTDLGDSLSKKIREEYGIIGADILDVSAQTGVGTDLLRERLSGKLAAFAGQSAVGKTSLVNRLFGLDLKVGELSEKVKRGRHTTTYSRIYSFQDVRIIDTPGFAVIEADLPANEIKDYYEDFLPYADQCKYRGCTHISEPSCKIKECVENGILSESRYERYCKLYEEQKEKKRHEY